MSVATPTKTRSRLFLGLPIPVAVVPALQKAIDHYPQYIEKVVPRESWHLTLVFLGSVENPKQYFSRLTKAMPQAFVPTVSLTYAGRGLQRDQLWAYAHVSPVLQNMREQLVSRLKAMRFPLKEDQYPGEYVPHIHLANLYAMSRGIGLADFPLTTSFAAQQVHLYESTLTPQGAHYTITGSIPLT